MPKIGGKRAGAGRPLGSKNRSTAEMRAACRMATDEAIETLKRIMKKSRKDSNRIHACRELLDRGHGKSAQPIEGEIGVKGRVTLSWLAAPPPKDLNQKPKQDL